MKDIRFKTLVKYYGKPKFCDGLDQERWDALKPDIANVITIHHADHNWRWYGSKGKSRVNVIGFLVFPKPIRHEFENVIGFGNDGLIEWGK